MDQASSRSKFKTSGDGSTAAGKGSRDAVHPFENSKDLLVVLANDAIDVEEEARLYDELRAATQSVSPDPSDHSQTPLLRTFRLQVRATFLNFPFVRLLFRTKMTRITYKP